MTTITLDIPPIPPEPDLCSRVFLERALHHMNYLADAIVLEASGLSGVHLKSAWLAPLRIAIAVSVHRGASLSEAEELDLADVILDRVPMGTVMAGKSSRTLRFDEGFQATARWTVMPDAQIAVLREARDHMEAACGLIT